MDIDGNLRLLVRAESVIGTTDPGTNGETGWPLDRVSSADWEPDQHTILHVSPKQPGLISTSSTYST